MNDPTEEIRRDLCAGINAYPSDRKELEEILGTPVYDTEQVTERFEVLGFLAPFVSVKEKSTGDTGTLIFQHNPRYYWGFERRG